MSRKSTRSRNTNPDYNGDGTDGDLEARLYQYNKENCSMKQFNNDLKKDNLESDDDDDDDDADIVADCMKRPASASSKTMRGTSAKRVSHSPQDEDDLEDNLLYDDDIDRNDEIGGLALPESAGGDDAAPPAVDEGVAGDDVHFNADVGADDAAPPAVDEGVDDDVPFNADVGANDAALPVVDEGVAGDDAPLAPPHHFTLQPPQPIENELPQLINCISIDNEGVTITDDENIDIHGIGYSRNTSNNASYNHQNAAPYTHSGNHYDGSCTKIPIGDWKDCFYSFPAVMSIFILHLVRFSARTLGASSGTTLSLHVSVVFPNFFNKDGSRNVSLSALLVDEDLLRILRICVQGKSVLGQEHVLQAKHFIECFIGGTLPDVSDGRTVRNWVKVVLDPNHHWDGGYFCRRAVDEINGEDSNYESNLHLRIVSNLQFLTETWLKKLHSVDVRGGLLERNQEVDIRSLDCSDAYMDFSGEAEREVQGIISEIRDIEQERVDSNRGISLLNVVMVGEEVARTVGSSGEQFNEIENRIGMALCVLSYKFMLPPLPDEAVIDWDQSYFGRVYTQLHSKKRNFDALRLFAMMTGRDDNTENVDRGVRGWLTRRGMVIRTRMIVQNDVSDDYSIRICLYLKDLAEELRTWVDERNDSREDTDED
eukprot:scaffold6914_cov155-Skeletonema_marinoi.AAC.4